MKQASAPSSTKQGVQAFHESRARGYLDQGYVSRNTDTLVKAHVRREVLALVDRAEARGRVLDVGCGPGVLAPALLERQYEYWGVDISPAMVREGSRRLPPEARLLVGDVERLGVPDGFFDVVTCVQVLDYLDGDEMALAEIRRVLKPGGVAVVSAVVLPSVAYALKRGLGAVIGLPPLRRYLRRRGLSFYPRTRAVFPGAFLRQLRNAGMAPERRAWANLVNIPFNAPLPGPAFPVLAGVEDMLSHSPIRGLGAIFIVQARKL